MAKIFDLIFNILDLPKLAEMLGEIKEAARELDYVRKRFPETPHAQVAQKRIVRYMAQAD